MKLLIFILVLCAIAEAVCLLVLAHKTDKIYDYAKRELLDVKLAQHAIEHRLTGLVNGVRAELNDYVKVHCDVHEESDKIKNDILSKIREIIDIHEMQIAFLAFETHVKDAIELHETTGKWDEDFKEECYLMKNEFNIKLAELSRMTGVPDSTLQGWFKKLDAICKK